MKDIGLDKGMIRHIDTSKREQKGWSKGFFSFRKMLRDFLTKLNVTFFDPCCEDANTEGVYPVRFNFNLQRLEYFNGTAWVDIVQIQETTTTTTTSTSTTTTTTAP